MHCRSRATLRRRAQISRIAKHLRKRYVGRDHLCATRPHLGSGKLPSTLHEIAIDGAHIIIWRYYLYPHYRFEQNRLGLLDRILESQRTSDNEGSLVRVNLVKTAVDETHFDVDQVIASEEAAFHGVVNALFGRLYELARNCAALNLVLENKAFARRRFNLKF